MNKRPVGFFIVVIVLAIILTMMQCNEMKTQPVTLCDTGIKYTMEVLVQPAVNKLIVTNKSGDQIFIVATDFNRDGNYTMLMFDTNGDGMADLKLTNGTATAEEVLKIYCIYQMLEIV